MDDWYGGDVCDVQSRKLGDEIVIGIVEVRWREGIGRGDALYIPHLIPKLTAQASPLLTTYSSTPRQV